MSELIDKIFDVEKISGEVAQILQNLNSLKGAISGINDLIKKDEGSARKAKDWEDLSKASKSLNDNFTAGQKPLKDFQTQLAELNAKTEQLTGAEKAAAIEVAKARLELQAAQKATKDAAIAEIELTAKNKDLAGSYNALNKDLKDSILAYKALSGEEAKGAKGKELLAKIQETQSALKASDAAMGNYQRNVGNYSESFKPLMGTFEKLMKTQNDVKGGAANMMGFFAGSKSGFDVFKAGVGASDESLKVLGKNPIIAVLAIIIGLFNAVKNSIGSSSKATNTLKEAMAPLNAAMTVAKNVTVAVLQVFLDAFLAISKFTTGIYAFISGNDKYTKSVQDAMAVERERQSIAKANRELIVEEAKSNLKVAELRDKVTEKDKYSRKEREAALREAIKLEQKMSESKVEIAKREYKNLVDSLKMKDELNSEEKTKLAEAEAKILNLQTEFYAKTRRIKTQAAAFNLAEDQAEQKAKEDAIKAEKEHTDKIIAARRRLIDSGFEIQKESEEKAAAMSKEVFNREVEDLKRNGELTKELLKNLTIKQQQEQGEIKKEWAAKRLNDSIQLDEIEISNMEKHGVDTLSARKELLKKQMEAEILAGGDLIAIQTKYQYLSADLEAANSDKKIEAFKALISKQADAMADGYKAEELELKKKYASGELKEKEYNDALSELKLRALYKTNEQTILALENQLDTEKMSEEKRAELSKMLSDLQIENENAVTDATIDENEKRVKADELATQKRLAVAQALGDATNQIFGAVADFAIQESERKVEALEKELEDSNAMFEQEQANLDNALMSDEARAIKQNEINEKKFQAEKVIKDKIQAEKIKQAKWEKAQALVNAVISSGLAILAALATKPFIPLGLIAAGLATTMGAIQVATIARQPLPAYEKGGITGEGLALWGEARPEVAVTPSGQTFLAEKPTISNFDAGTRIFKSVSDYENFLNAKNSTKFEFDYDRFGEKMPQNKIILDGAGLWSIVNKQNSRLKMINRRYSR